MFARPTPRAVFLKRAKRLRVFFYTSSVQKYLQAKYVFEQYGLVLEQFKHDRPYVENEDKTSAELLADGVDDILKYVGSGSLFFIEDTSLRIEILSDGDRDFPGLYVKDWFASTTFAELDAQLPRDIIQRRVVVKSDIALHIPGLADPVFFHGESIGTVSLDAPDFEENRFHPWLTPKTFNGWFVPDGAQRALGSMSFDESWKFDFRGRALASLVSRLEEYAAVANAETVTYNVERTPVIEQNHSLFPPDHGRILVVVGKTCAGKTTLAHNAKEASQKVMHIEASAVLRASQRSHDSTDTHTFAHQILTEEGADFVAREILDLYDLRDHRRDFVITGFRTIEEVLYLKERFPRAEIILVESPEKTRYSRHVARGRIDLETLEEFRRHDRDQWRFGLLRVAADFSDYRIDNVGSLDTFGNQTNAVLAETEFRGVTKNVRPQYRLFVHRLYRCLDILEEAAQALSCDEIEVLSVRLPRRFRGLKKPDKGSRYTGKVMSGNNVNKVLKGCPELVERLDPKGERVKYRILSAGKAYLKIMNDYAFDSSG